MAVLANSLFYILGLLTGTMIVLVFWILAQTNSKTINDFYTKIFIDPIPLSVPVQSG